MPICIIPSYNTGWKASTRKYSYAVFSSLIIPKSTCIRNASIFSSITLFDITNRSTSLIYVYYNANTLILYSTRKWSRARWHIRKSETCRIIPLRERERERGTVRYIYTHIRIKGGEKRSPRIAGSLFESISRPRVYRTPKTTREWAVAARVICISIYSRENFPSVL